MREQLLFYIVFTSQVLLLSFIFPRAIVRRMRHVRTNYPPSEYPRLYAKPIERYESAERRYWVLNMIVFAVGLALIGDGLLSGRAELLGWDTGTMVFPYFMLQYVPLLLMGKSGLVYFSPVRRADSRTTRSAALRPRRLASVVSPALLGLAALVYLAFALLIAWVDRFDYPWFGGYFNIVGITGMNLFFAAIVWVRLYGKRRDPYQTEEARMQRAQLTARVLTLMSIAATVFVAMSIVLRIVEMPSLIPIAKSVYFQLLIILAWREFGIDDIDFEVYREDPALA